MSEENKELMEITEENEVIDSDYCGVEEGGSGKAIALAAGVVTGVAALGVAVYKKLKAKKEDKPKKPKKRLRWVEVDEEENDVIDVESEEIDEEESEK